jgi:hypothetical protein
MTVWQKNLEIIGAELFQRYRKRLLAPGIVWVIRDDYPGLSFLDVMIRVHAGRRIIELGDDFRALRAIRSGNWQRVLWHKERRRPTAGERKDWLSRALVRLGGALFTGFCLLCILASLATGPGGGWLVLILGCCGLTFFAVAHRQQLANSRRLWRDRKGDTESGGRHAAPSV